MIKTWICKASSCSHVNMQTRADNFGVAAVRIINRLKQIEHNTQIREKEEMRREDAFLGQCWLNAPKLLHGYMDLAICTVSFMLKNSIQIVIKVCTNLFSSGGPSFLVLRPSSGTIGPSPSLRWPTQPNHQSSQFSHHRHRRPRCSVRAWKSGKDCAVSHLFLFMVPKSKCLKFNRWQWMWDVTDLLCWLFWK